ncbi:MAG: ATP-dependent DNA helicase RecG [Pseudomonadota bacterium]
MTEEGPRDYLEAIERPLKYVDEGDPRRIQTVKNLSQHVLDVSREALASNLAEREMRMFRALQELFSGYDDLGDEEKRRRISEARSLISGKPARQPRMRSFLLQEHPVPDTSALKLSYQRLGGNVQFVKGVGPSIASKFDRVGIRNVGDLLMFFPLRYEDRRAITPIRELKDGVAATVIGTVTFSGVAFYRGLRRRVFEVTIEDETGSMKLKWFHFILGSLEQRVKRGQRLIVCGKTKVYRSKVEMYHPDFEVHTGQLDSVSFGRIVPVYREVGGLYQKTLRKVLNYAVATYAGERRCVIPPEICERLDLLPPWKAIAELHAPAGEPKQDRREILERSLAFEELFFYCLSLALRKRIVSGQPGIAFDRESPRYGKLIDVLPFRLTDAQKKVLESIRSDMAAARPMNRLLQGDVGSGKTIVAMLAALVAVDHGYQAGFMAPTEILAEQHLRTLTSWGKQVGIRIGCLLGCLSTSERKEVLRDVEEGKIDILVGTHALLEKDVRFKSLGFVVVDEQHRFGVRQRATIRSKALAPDVLVMSATPIPRTLALTLYGDLDVSILNELPAGRKPIETNLYSEKDRERVYAEVRKAVSEGQQAYVVYPLVEPSEQLQAKDATSMAEELKEGPFRDFRVALIHGQMPGLQKEEVMGKFVRGEIDVLVSTTVIEVGIDVPNATVMVIEHPERFGLSQLHQLRGRVGRGSEKSSCLLIVPSGVSVTARNRLRVFARVHDGFLLAEEDLRVRGPGDFFGVEQSGFPSFAVAVFPRDLSLLESARREAFTLLEEDRDLRRPGHAHLTWFLEQVWQDKLNLVRVG